MSGDDQARTAVQSTAGATFSAAVYSLSAVKAAAYRIAASAAVRIDSVDGEITCTLVFSKPLSAGEAADVVHQLTLEVLDQDLRESIAAETAPVRNAILAHAFSKTGLQG